MSSFTDTRHIYLFDMKNGKRKLCYGRSPQDALEILRMRLTEAEMAEILTEQCVKISQRSLQKYISELG